MSKVPLGEKPEIDDIVILKENDYLGTTYGGSDAKITMINNGVLYDVEAYDGKVFTVTRSHFYTIDEYYNIDKPKPKTKCTCGAHFTQFPQHHMFYCDLYKDIMEGK